MIGVQGVVHRRLVWVLDLRCAVPVLGGFCGRGWCFGVCRPCFGWYLWTGWCFGVSCSCLGGELSGRSWGALWRVMGRFVVGKLLCVRALLNVLAAKGEQGEVGSDWYTWSCAPLCCASPCWLGRFCDVSSMFWVVLWTGGVGVSCSCLGCELPGGSWGALWWATVCV